MRARRVLHVIESLGYGGAEQQLCLLARGLDERGHQSTIVHLFDPAHHAPGLEADGIPVIGLGLPRGTTQLLPAVTKLRRIVEMVEPDIVHSSLLFADLSTHLALRGKNVPSVSTLCNVVDPDLRLQNNPDLSRLKMGVTWRLWGHTLRAKSHLIAISEAVAQSVSRSQGVPRDHMSVVYRAITERALTGGADRPAFKRTLGLPDGAAMLLTVGRLAPQKGHVHLVRAMGAVTRRHPNVHLVVVGEGWLKEELVGLTRLEGVENHIHFLGRRTDVPDLMTAADVFVFPSLFEGLGVALLEAASFGAPCVATDAGAIREILVHGQSGLLVPPQDPESLAGALLRLLGDRPLARRLGDAAKCDVRTRFSVDAMLEGTRAVYEHATT